MALSSGEISGIGTVWLIDKILGAFGGFVNSVDSFKHVEFYRWATSSARHRYLTSSPPRASTLQAATPPLQRLSPSSPDSSSHHSNPSSPPPSFPSPPSPHSSAPPPSVPPLFLLPLHPQPPPPNSPVAVHQLTAVWPTSAHRPAARCASIGSGALHRRVVRAGRAGSGACAGATGATLL